MASDADTVAERLRSAFAESYQAGHDTLMALYAEKVVLRHDPPRPSDGPFDRATLLELGAAGRAALHKAIAGYHWDDVQIDARDDKVVIEAVHAGTLNDGSTLNAPLKMSLTVVDGQIAGVDTQVDEQAGAPLVKALEQANLTAPR
jgi:ketosteroid isomerase-like protein